MRVIWTPEAEQDRLEIFDHIAYDSPRAAISMDELFSDAACRLAAYPEMGKPGRIPGTRELVLHANYRLIYEIDASAVWLLALVHNARQWPSVK